MVALLICNLYQAGVCVDTKFGQVPRVTIVSMVIAAEMLHRHSSMEYTTGMFVANYMETVLNDTMPLGFSRYPLL